ncbi:16S rRNA processing protein RimM [Arboricoccus pini]|uniref:Ribosome maturation factor RimM n=1 Tax=Arboricoccus pini TaxID=1963835 RepID=A0A212QNR6_9PROT|nr:ribosome maturation factor RimM [Arboricoccus pini]SNB60979.1 16S rRNA processing protein RimM [Arboricoccus pini]
MPASEPSRFVCVAAIAAAHGVRGAMKLKCFTADPEAVAGYGPLYDANGKALFTVRIQSSTKDGVIVTAPGIMDRDAASSLRGTLLYIPRDALPPLADDEFYLDDLVGLICLDEVGQKCGHVVAVYNFGAGDIVEIRGEDGREHMLPFTRDYFPDVDSAKGRVTVRLPGELVASAER